MPGHGAAAPGVIISASASNSGKTLITLGLLGALAHRGVAVISAKTGPDYIDPAFHAAASGRPCRNLDPWAMRPALLHTLAASLAHHAQVVITEGVMGLLDGAETQDPLADGSTAHLARLTGWPVVMVIDGRGMAGSAAAVLAGFAQSSPQVQVAGVIFNRVGGDKHRRMIARACARLCPHIPILGFIPPLAGLVIPSRHLGLVQAGEHPDLDAFLTTARQAMAEHVDLDRLLTLARPLAMSAPAGPVHPLPPLGQRIAVACDQAFSFAYPAILDGWRAQGAEIFPFSPLDDQAPQGDSVYLPGGYPELHAGRLAHNDRFLDGLRRLAAAGAPIYGECGGYMTLGQTLVDADGQGHAMAGLLPLDTSFAKRHRHLGYRQARLRADTPFGPAGSCFRGHEFHFSTATAIAGLPLFDVTDAWGDMQPAAGLTMGRVFGSYLHLIDRM